MKIAKKYFIQYKNTKMQKYKNTKMQKKIQNIQNMNEGATVSTCGMSQLETCGDPKIPLL